jgi:hypothetical protein
VKEDESEVLNLWGATLVLNPWVPVLAVFAEVGIFARKTSAPLNYLLARSVPPAR